MKRKRILTGSFKPARIDSLITGTIKLKSSKTFSSVFSNSFCNLLDHLISLPVANLALRILTFKAANSSIKLFFFSFSFLAFCFMNYTYCIDHKYHKYLAFSRPFHFRSLLLYSKNLIQFI